jgi:rhodanese-related sulfurtransferase
MKRFADLIADALPEVREVFPWDLEAIMESDPDILLLDIREPYEFDAARIPGSVNVPRGILESASEYGYEETTPELVRAREREVIVICRSGNRSVLAALTMQIMGYQNVCSLKTGLKGWTDAELPLIRENGEAISVDDAEDYFTSRLSPEQLPPED